MEISEQKIEKGKTAFLHDILHCSGKGTVPVCALLSTGTKPEVDYVIQTQLILSRKCGIYQRKENTML